MYYSALLGSPVDHSVSPILFSLLARIAGIEYAHIKIDTPDKKLHEYLTELSNLGFRGVNITIPYKLRVGEYVNTVSAEAEKIGAINTIVFEPNNWVGYNTDAIGALYALEKQVRPLSNADHALILGAGGAARAIIYELLKKDISCVVLNRTLERAQKLKSDFKTQLLMVDELSDNALFSYARDASLICQTTSVGMEPNTQISLIKHEIMQRIPEIENKIFFDMILNPAKTKFLLDAENSGAQTCSGLYMMIYQCIEAFNLWTGIDLSKSCATELYDELINQM